MSAAEVLTPPPTWRYDHLFAISRISWLIHSIVVGLTLLVFYDLVPDYLYWSWGAVMGALTIALACLGFTYKKTTPLGNIRARQYGVYHSIVVGLIGLNWGVGALYATGQSDALALFYTFVLGGTALGAVSSQHSLLRSCMLSVWTSIPPLAIGLAAFGPKDIGWPMAWLVCLFGITLSIIAVRMNRFLTRSVAMASSLDSKVVELTELSKQLDQARAKAEQSERSKSQLLAQASHDMRHPVHAIGLMAEALRLRLKDPENLQTIERINQSVESLAQLFRSLLDMSALDSGRIKKTVSETRLNTILSSVASQFVEAEQEGRLRWVPCSAWVKTDPALLHTIIQNLVANALKHGNNGRVLMGCRKKNGTLSIEIHDTGPGIKEDDQSRIFDAFVCLNPKDLGSGEGLGLGLSIVKRMSDILGLTIHLRSTLQKGTSFAIDGLEPIRPTKKQKIQKAKQAGLSLENLRITLIEPDKKAQGHLTSLMAQWGCTVETRSSITEIAKGTDTVLLAESAIADPENPAAFKDLKKHYQVIVMATPSDTPTSFPTDIPKLKKPVTPMQLRSLLLTTAIKVENRKTQGQTHV